MFYEKESIKYNKDMRTTSEKKDNILRIRISDEMYRYLIHKSERDNVSISQYIRNIISKDMFQK